MGITDRRQREKEQRRTEILNAAERFFFSLRYDDVSMDGIANEVELTKTTLYLYFRNKEALFTAVVLRGLMLWRDLIRNAEQEKNSGIDKLALIGKATFRFVNQYPDYYRLYKFFRSGRFDIERVTDNDDMKEIHAFFQEIFIISNNAIETGIGDGSIRSDIDPVELAVLLTIMSDSINNVSPALRNKLESRGIDQERFVNDFINFIYHMIENPERTTRHKKSPR